TLLLLFGLQWYRKGIIRVAARGLAGYHGQDPPDEPIPPGFDWTAAFLAFKGVSLEGLEIAIIVVSFGGSAGQLGPAILGGTASLRRRSSSWNGARHCRRSRWPGHEYRGPSRRRGRAIPVRLRRRRRSSLGSGHGAGARRDRLACQRRRQRLVAGARSGRPAD